MHNLFNCEYPWNDRAKFETSLLTMLDTYLYTDEVSISIPARRYAPWRVENCKSGLYWLNELYHDYKDFILDIVEIFFPTHVFTPSEIRNTKSNEYFLFKTLSAINYIVWYQKIEKSRPRGYEKENKELDAALSMLCMYADYSEITKLIDFPAHQNETIKKLEIFFKNNNRIQQGEKVISTIKKYLNIEKVTATKRQKMIYANKRALEKIKEDLNITDEELHKIPVIGQLKTEL
jgi:hypothetical protein